MEKLTGIGPEAIKEVRSGGLKVVTVQGTMQAIYQFWGLYRPEAKGSPVTDVRVREALSLFQVALACAQVAKHQEAGQGVFQPAARWTFSRWAR